MTLERQGGAPDLSGFRILVVEDEYFLADDMRQALTSLGAEVLGPFQDPEQAAGLVEREGLRPDAAVLDINLRGRMVYPLAEVLRARDIPFVFATGYDPAGIPAGFADVPRWEKPFDPAALAKVLPGLLQRRS